jgi:long-chain acyl-CoA synthetase
MSDKAYLSEDFPHQRYAEQSALLPISDEDLILQKVYQWESQFADRVCMTQPMGKGVIKEYNWKDMMHETRKMASYLKSLNFPAGSQIAILSKNCAHFIMSDIAIWMAGHTSVALYPTLTADTVSYILDHSESRLLFVGKLDTWDDMKSGVPADLPCIAFPLSPPTQYDQWSDIVAQQKPMTEQITRAEDETAILVYTSGSTGQPKGVAHTFGNLVRIQKGMAGLLCMSPKDRLLSYLPLAHVFERAVIEVSLFYHGCHVFFAESLLTFVEDLKRAKPTVFHSVPRLWLKFQMGVFAKKSEEKLDFLFKIPILNKIVKKKILANLGLDQTRLAVSGSAPIPRELISWYNNLGLELLEGYGMSENFCYSHFTNPGEVKPGKVGTSNPGVDTKLSKEGEILVKSPCNMIGYFKQPEMTQDSFTEDFYLKTGDRGVIDRDGALRITGRVKELFKTSKGKYVAPVPIENLINASSLIEQCCVAGSGQVACHALILLNESLRARLNDPAMRAKVEPELNALLKSVNGQIEPFEKIKFFSIVKDEWSIEAGFLTPTMKIKRNVIEESYAGELDTWYDGGEGLYWQS